MDRHAIKQVDRLLSNAGVVVWDLFAPWAREVVGQRKAIVVAMDWTDFDGFVTLPCREREVSAPQELSGRCDCSPPRGHRNTAKRAVRLGGDEMALDVEGIVDGGMCGKKLLG